MEIDGERLDVDAALRPVALDIFRLETQIYALRSKAVNDAIAQRLLEREAARRGVSLEQLLREEVEARIQPPTPEEIDAVVARTKRAEDNAAVLRESAKSSLITRRRAQVRGQYVAGLRARSSIAVRLPVPATMKAAIRLEGQPARGPADAPVTIVEFADFQCPFCVKVQPTLAAVLRKFSGKVRLVYRDFPIAKLHPTAPKASEAARCAGEQGKFWQYHDVLYANFTRQALPDLLRYAESVALDMTPFRECVTSGRHATAVAESVAEGQRIGVSGTPTFFVNGAPLVGARSVGDFTTVIEQELQRLAVDASGTVTPSRTRASTEPPSR